MIPWTKILLLISILSFPLQSLADERAVLRMGADFTHYKNRTSIYSLGWEDFNSLGLGHKFELGGWTDETGGRCSSPYGSILLGKELGTSEGLNLTGFVGLSIIGYTDAALSSPFEFTEEAAVGYQNVGIGYKHFSNAGLSEPNHGRDYIFLNLRFPI